MAGALSGGYFPVYPHHGDLPDPEIRTFITNFYRVSDKRESNELWVSHFTKDADVQIGKDKGQGEQGIRELRGRMWNNVKERRHRVAKVFPARFQDPESAADGTGTGTGSEPVECEWMLFGDVAVKTEDGQDLVREWAGHAIVRQETEGERTEWKFRHYQVWLQL